MSDINRTYNGFNRGAIYPSTNNGWVDYKSDINNTPINANNLNAMLQMLIDIRNVIGKTDAFADSINGNKNISKPKEDGSISVATYIKAVADAIIGSNSDNPSLSDANRLTLNNIKNYLNTYFGNSSDIDIKDGDAVTSLVEALNLESHIRNSQTTELNQGLKDELETRKNADNDLLGTDADSLGETIKGLKNHIKSLNTTQEAEDSKWIKSITQTDGKISKITTAQPEASDISYIYNDDNANISGTTTLDRVVKKLDELISNLSEALSEEKQARENSDNALLGTGASDSDNTIKKNKAEIDAINDTETGIKATLIGTDSDNKDDNTINGAKKYTDTEIVNLKNFILNSLTEINCGSSTELIDNGGTN